LKDGKVVSFIEVKYHFDKLNPAQIRAHKLLKKHGIPIRTERVPKIIESPLYKKLFGGDKKDDSKCKTENN